MDESKKIRVLIADDHLILRTGLRSIIEAEPDMLVAAEATDGRQAVEDTSSINRTFSCWT
jgi:YesN/AraC family two-component response regulator